MTGVVESRCERVVGAFLVAFAVGVAAPLPAAIGVSGTEGALAAAAGVAVGVGLVAAAGVRQAESLLEGLASPRLLLVPSVAAVAWTALAVVHSPAVRATALLPFAVAFAGCVLGVTAWVLARDAHDRRRRETAATAVAFKAPLPPRARRAMRLGGAVTMGGGVVAAAGMGVAGDVALSFTFLPLASTGVVFLALSQTSREVRVADEGLFVNRSLRSWRDFESARVENDVLVVDGRGRWTGTLRFDASAIEDVDGVAAAVRARIHDAACQSSPDS
jgi:hypothetical protein